MRLDSHLAKYRTTFGEILAKAVEYPISTSAATTLVSNNVEELQGVSQTLLSASTSTPNAIRAPLEKIAKQVCIPVVVFAAVCPVLLLWWLLLVCFGTNVM